MSKCHVVCDFCNLNNKGREFSMAHKAAIMGKYILDSENLIYPTNEQCSFTEPRMNK